MVLVTTYNYYNNDNLKQILKNSVAQLSYVYDGVGNVIFVKDSKGFVTTLIMIV